MVQQNPNVVYSMVAMATPMNVTVLLEVMGLLSGNCFNVWLVLQYLHSSCSSCWSLGVSHVRSSSSAALRPWGGTTTHAPQRMQPSMMLSSFLLDLNGFNSSSTLKDGYPSGLYLPTVKCVLLWWLLRTNGLPSVLDHLEGSLILLSLVVEADLMHLYFLGFYLACAWWCNYMHLVSKTIAWSLKRQLAR